MNIKYPSTYVEFRQHVSTMIHNAEMMALHLMEKGESSEPKRGSKKSGGNTRRPENDDGLAVKLVEVLNTSSGVFHLIKN